MTPEYYTITTIRYIGPESEVPHGTFAAWVKGHPIPEGWEESDLPPPGTFASALVQDETDSA